VTLEITGDIVQSEVVCVRVQSIVVTSVNVALHLIPEFTSNQLSILDRDARTIFGRSSSQTLALLDLQVNKEFDVTTPTNIRRPPGSRHSKRIASPPAMESIAYH